jgi:hypothetical protein
MTGAQLSVGRTTGPRPREEAAGNGRDGIGRIVKPVHSDESERKRAAFQLSSGMFRGVAFLQYLKSVQGLTHT